MLNTTFKSFDISKKGQTRYACHVMRGRAPPSGSKTFSLERNVTVFDMFYSGIKKYTDGDTYVDENEVTILAFHLPHHSFSPLKIWPRKYISDEPIEDDEAPSPGGLVHTGEMATSEAAGEGQGDGGFDEAKESYLDYKRRLRREKKEAESRQQAAPQTAPGEAEDLVQASGEKAIAADNDDESVMGKATPEKDTMGGITQEMKDKAAAVERRWAERNKADNIFLKSHQPEGEDESQGAAILTRHIPQSLSPPADCIPSKRLERPPPSTRDESHL